MPMKTAEKKYKRSGQECAQATQRGGKNANLLKLIAPKLQVIIGYRRWI